MAHRAFSDASLARLGTRLRELKTMANSAASLSGDVAELAKLTSDVFGEMDAMLDGKLNAPLLGSLVIPTTGWQTGSLGVYTKFYDLPIPGITAKDIVEVTLAPESQPIASQCGLCTTNDSQDGGIRLWAMSIPAAPIEGSFRVFQIIEAEEKEEDEEGDD